MLEQQEKDREGKYKLSQKTERMRMKKKEGRRQGDAEAAQEETSQERDG